jgi:hypothetical protein
VRLGRLGGVLAGLIHVHFLAHKDFNVPASVCGSESGGCLLT